MDTINDVHLQFSSYFNAREIAPFLYLLSQKMEEGSTCLAKNEFLEDIKDDFPFDVNKYSWESLEHHSLVSTDPSILNKPFLLDHDRLYFQRYFIYEINFIEKIKQLVHAGQHQMSQKLEKMAVLHDAFATLFPSIEPNMDWQKIATFFTLLNHFTIITGGPGTGKTTTVSKILELEIALRSNVSIALAAPTGKAAARMTESLRNAAKTLKDTTREKFATLKPSTIHRLLGTIRDSIYFKHDSARNLPYDIIVVDECSMIDIALFSKLLNAIGEHTKLILLGDKDQLSSVEVGSLFGDLCNTVHQLNHFSSSRKKIVNSFFEKQLLETMEDNGFLQDNIIELKESRRFDKNKGIGKLSDIVIHNKEEDLQSFLVDHKVDQVSFDFERSDIIWQKFALQYSLYMQEQSIVEALKLLDHQRILCAVKEGEYGNYKMNQKVEDYLYALKYIDKKNSFYENRPIMVMENNYELGLYNGDIGILRSENGMMKAWFIDSDNTETGLKSVLPGLISHIETVYAMTIHKSQGSEFEHVMVVLPEQTSSENMLTRELLYTAITRAKKSVVISSSKQMVIETTNRQVQRNSGVLVRL